MNPSKMRGRRSSARVWAIYETAFKYGFEHLDHPSRDLGFECHVNGQAMLRWLSENRTQDLANALCKVLGVALVQAQELEIFGRWDWLYETEACDCSHETEAQAAMDAYLSCGLLDIALEAGVH